MKRLKVYKKYRPTQLDLSKFLRAAVALIVLFFGIAFLSSDSVILFLDNLTRQVADNNFLTSMALELPHNAEETTKTGLLDMILSESGTIRRSHTLINKSDGNILGLDPSPLQEDSATPSQSDVKNTAQQNADNPIVVDIPSSGEKSLITSPTETLINAPDKNNISEITIAVNSGDGYLSGSGVYIKNNTKTQTLNVDYLLGRGVPWAISGKGPHILIVHTHGSESYLPGGGYDFETTDSGRTQDTNFNVVKVGDELEKILSDAGYNVVHDRQIHDYPSYNGSYSATLEAIKKQMGATPSIKVIIDVHRDSMQTKEGVQYRPVTEVDGKRAAQVMLVMGTGEGGLPHDNWLENMKLALRLQKNMNETYPNLARPILLTSNRFNQHATMGSMLIEVGTQVNTLDEAIYGAQLFGKSLSTVLKEFKE